MNARRLRRALGGLTILSVMLSACAQTLENPEAVQAAPKPGVTAVEPIAVDLREEIQHIPVTVKSLSGRAETKRIPLTIFRPPGDGRFPLVIVSHGRPVGDKRAQQPRQRFEALARYLVSKGFAVMVPTRVGYGETYGDFDPEAAGGCNVMRLEPASIAASDQVLAALEYAKTQPDIDTSRWVAMGQSVGGLATVAVAWRHPSGLVAAINFAGGAGGDPDRRPGDPCSPTQIEKLWRSKAAESAIPMLWLYWQNDKFWGADIPRRWAAAWAEGGGRLDFRTLPPVGADGHGGMSIDMDTWVPLVESYLAERGFSRSGLVPRPPATQHAAIGDVAKLPAATPARAQVYGRFLAAKSPRAFAIGPNGAAGWATGDWAMGRALGFCQARRGVACKLYAVDDDVVWTP